MSIVSTRRFCTRSVAWIVDKWFLSSLCPCPRPGFRHTYLLAYMDLEFFHAIFHVKHIMNVWISTIGKYWWFKEFWRYLTQVKPFSLIRLKSGLIKVPINKGILSDKYFLLVIKPFRHSNIPSHMKWSYISFSLCGKILPSSFSS